MPKGTIRVLASLALAILAVAAAAKPPLPDEARVVAVVVIAAVAALSSRSSLLLVAARKGSLTVDASAPKHRLLLETVPAALLGALLAAPLAMLPAVHARFEVLVAGVVGALSGVALAAARDKKPKAARTSTTFTWLVVDTALPAGVVATCFGVCLAFLRLHSKDVVEPGELARHLAGTLFVYAALLGLGGFFKAYGELSAGLVVVDTAKLPHAAVPGPVVVGGVLGLAALFAIPPLAPSLALDDVLAIKAVAGLVVGGGCSLLGAIRGARAAVEKRSGRDDAPGGVVQPG
jgi:hypothetical protein